MRPLALIILDGFGYNPRRENNAVALARMPFYNRLWEQYPRTFLRTSGESVGLPEGQMGNSEVGHLNLGAGRIVYQDFTRINKSIREGDFFKNSVLQNAMTVARESKGALHLLGLLSDGGVHSHIQHLFALLEMARQAGVKETYCHAFLDGRDTPPQSGIGYLAQLEEYFQQKAYGKIATLGGRYWGMDRDKRWERVEKHFKTLVLGEGRTYKSSAEAIEDAYRRGETDEFVTPSVIVDTQGKSPATIKDKDVIIFFNFRADRARQITRAFTEKDFNGFPVSYRPKLSYYACMTEYDHTFLLPAAFPPQTLDNILGQLCSQKGAKQLRIAETEKYAHVTYFFNGGIEEPFPGEDRVLIPSPKVATYDLKPEMSAFEVTDELVQRIRSKIYDLIVLNYANGDMVGHTGILEAAIKACEALDQCLEKVVTALLQVGGGALITSDHGNAEQMYDPATHGPHTAHTLNLVPFLAVTNPLVGKLQEGILADVAPTILKLWGWPQPKEMTGKSLII
jgi:2,3-bisphosphoglycerate-independent phosphoglycerate mutase